MISWLANVVKRYDWVVISGSLLLFNKSSKNVSKSHSLFLIKVSSRYNMRSVVLTTESLVELVQALSCFNVDVRSILPSMKFYISRVESDHLSLNPLGIAISLSSKKSNSCCSNFMRAICYFESVYSLTRASSKSLNRPSFASSMLPLF